MLQGNNLDIAFNETRTNSYTVKGYSIKSDELGIKEAQWETLTDIKESIVQMQTAISGLRTVSENLGNAL